MDRAFGNFLKGWRGRRRFSQLDLALAANVSARHIAFLETGRSNPSRDMVVHLSEALEIPRAERNALLNAAGFAPGYRRRRLDDEDMADVAQAVSWMLERHDPYPAFAVDRHWHLVKTNACGNALLANVGIATGDSMLEALVSSPRLRDVIVNWPDVAHHIYRRLRTESAHFGGDAVLDAAANTLFKELQAMAVPAGGELPPVVPTLYRAGDRTLAFISTIAQFGTAEDIALADLKIELLFPADETTRKTVLSQAAK